MRPNRFLVERNAPEISYDEEGECAAPTGKLMRKAEIDLHIAGEVAAAPSCRWLPDIAICFPDGPKRR
jgi:hypothetical protein